jgi:hypothetical protein
MPAPDPSTRKRPDGGLGVAAVGVAAVAVLCCAGLPILAALAGSIALGILLGVGAGAVAAVLVVGAIARRARARRARCRRDGGTIES